MKQDKVHGIGTVSKRTGLGVHVIRAWERRYGAVEPHRSEGNQRLYSEDDMTRLMLLHRATEHGMTISRATTLDDEALRSFVNEERSLTRTTGGRPRSSPEVTKSIEEYTSDGLRLVEAMDQEGLEELLNEATVRHGTMTVLDAMIGVFLTKVGERWRNGEFRIYHEHLASSVIRTYLGRTLSSQIVSEGRPYLIATTPIGQLHELGALLCATIAATEQIKPIFLGANTPAEEVLRVATLHPVRFVALSVYYPERDPRVVEEIDTIRRSLPEEVSILIGGYAASWYVEQVAEPGVLMVDTTQALRDLLLRVG